MAILEQFANSIEEDFLKHKNGDDNAQQHGHIPSVDQLLQNYHKLLLRLTAGSLHPPVEKIEPSVSEDFIHPQHPDAQENVEHDH